MLSNIRIYATPSPALPTAARRARSWQGFSAQQSAHNESGLFLSHVRGSPYRCVLKQSRLFYGRWCQVCRVRFDATDVGWFYAQLEGQLKDRFKKSWVDVVGTEDKRLLFGDFMNSESTQYVVIPDMDELIDKVGPSPHTLTTGHSP